MIKNTILALVFLAAGVALTVWGIMNLSTAMQTNSWPTADGKITSSQVVKKIERYTDSDRHSRTRTIYTPEVRYRYEVGGNSFSGSRITVDDYGNSSESRARNISTRYPVGSLCKVFYNPNNPGESVLEAGITFMTLLLPGIGIVFAFAGFAILIWGRKSASSGSC